MIGLTDTLLEVTVQKICLIQGGQMKHTQQKLYKRMPR